MTHHKTGQLAERQEYGKHEGGQKCQKISQNERKVKTNDFFFIHFGLNDESPGVHWYSFVMDGIC